MCKKIPKTSEWKKQKTKNNEVSWWCNTVHVKSLARIESFWVFSSGFNSLMNNISKIYLDIQTLIYIFFKTKNCFSSKWAFDRLCSSRCFPITECSCSFCVGVNVGWCTRHNLRRTDYIQICKSRSYHRRLLFFNLGREPGQIFLFWKTGFILNADVGA